VILILLQAAPSGVPGPGPGGALVPGSTDPTLETVGLALLAYGLVQLLSRVLDKLLTARAAQADHPPPQSTVTGGFRDDDRKRLEKTFEMLTADRERLRRMADAIAEIHEATKWIAEQRTRTDSVDGQPMWNCRARGFAEQLNTQQRLVGQALDELRGLNRQNETMLRRLRAVWKKLGRWRS
jgi:septal ring factor EnvC (AmiA/AmiB activator)